MSIYSILVAMFCNHALMLASPHNNRFSPEEIENHLSSIPFSASVKNSLSSFFNKHHITGCAFALDPNIAFIVDGQNPSYILTYKDNNGNVKSRLYRSLIRSIGLKAECAIRLNLMFITDKDFTFEDTNKTIILSRGVEVHMPYILGGISVSYVSFVNAPGGMFTLSMSIGPSISAASYIYGGYLTPAY